jgi:hypothetical protein
MISDFIKHFEVNINMYVFECCHDNFINNNVLHMWVIEKAHMKFCKFSLGVGKRISNLAVK